MLHKAATSFSPFKLQHLHGHIRSALNLNLGSNATNNWQSATSASASAPGSAAGNAGSSSLGSSASQAGGSAGSAKWHAGRSYGYHTYGRSATPAANAAASPDGSASNKTLDDEDDLAKIRAAERALGWRNGRTFAGRQRSSSLSNPGLTTGIPLSTSTPSPSSANNSQTDDSSPILPRSSPYSFNQQELQARYRHAFSQAKRPQLLLTETAANAPQSTARLLSTSSTSLPSASAPVSRSSSPAPFQTRRNSTSAAEASSRPSDIVLDPPLPSKAEAEASAAPTSAFPAAAEGEHPPAAEEERSQITTSTRSQRGPTYPPLVPDLSGPPPPDEVDDSSTFQYYTKAVSQNQDVVRLRSFAKLYRQHPSSFSANRHQNLIYNLHLLRQYSDTSEDILELWGDFFKHDMLPPLTAYSVVLETLGKRSLDTDRIVKSQQLQNNAASLANAAESWAKGEKHQAATGSAGQTQADPMHSQSSLAALKQQSEEDYSSARKILRTLGTEGRQINQHGLNALLTAASSRGDVDTALTVFGHLEGRPTEGASRATSESFRSLLLTYVKAGDARAVKTVFEAFQKGKGRAKSAPQKSGRKARDLLESGIKGEQAKAPASPEATLREQRQQDGQVWDAMIYGHVVQGDGPAGLELLEKMMSTSSGQETPIPTGTTLLSLIQGFSETGDLESAFRWANKIHTLPTPSDLPTPAPRLEDTLNTIIVAAPTGSGEDVAKIQDAAGQTPLLPQLGLHIRLLAGFHNASEQQPSSPVSPDETPKSPSDSSSFAASSHDLGSVFSDRTVRSRTLSITPPPAVQNLVPESQAVTLDLILSTKLDDMARSGMKPVEIYGIVKDARRDGVHAYPEALARLVEKLASINAISEMEDIYLIAYNNLASLPTTNEQTSSWAYLEDRMLIAMANMGELGKAAMHRDRLLQAGAAPSADSYAAMITSAKDTTDDATVALELFEEARRFGVVPNLYLFNILISKLSKARRTHLALSYFEQMKGVGIRPSAVTYGSVIAACCRTGDEKAATFLFNEMVNSRGFRPRVPPYNTMMQFFISTHPDREKALSYFDALLRAGVAPTGHTYKLLLDAYGSIQPVDMASVNDVFERLVADPHVMVTGVHWASLLNAYGCVQKDLDKAIEIFDSIATHPASETSKNVMPDVICYEGLFNVLLANGRADLIETYRRAMEGQFVRPTAYIYNTLIRAHAASGNVDKARELFESLSDPSSGVAATGNHALEASSHSQTKDAVFREPSTYETMIRCELGAGNQARAEELSKRAVGRAFPAAIVAKLERLVKGEESAGPLFGMKEAEMRGQ